ncbi:permease-like cell division protein FtsX [Catellicoccus marimammalium]|uniref:Cell division protein FtsX n=1 Tax=Catellicoccus marimammalium M35/04/3 TaxID=1234409 RepID=K8Z9G2_9ENTE|nr:permease-like cell division protein FtsX [Catellicoccus marimammalium]EKU27664.1 Cell division protein FtsX [Catellicoccus marimammalium M35/04/3]
MIRTFFRHFVDSLKNLKRNGWMSFASIAAVTVTLTLFAAFLTFIFNMNEIAANIQKNVTVSVFMDPKITNSQKQILKEKLEDLPEVSKVTYSSKEEQYKKLVQTMGKEWEVFSKEDNPLYDVYMVQSNNPKETQKIQDAAKKMPQVIDASYGGAEAERLLHLADKVKLWGVIIAVVLLIIAIFLISNTIRVTILSRKQEIQIQRLVGATNTYIRWPFFLEGAWIGLLGSIIPILGMSFIYPKIYQMLMPTLQQAGYHLLTPGSWVIGLSVGIAILGMVIGALGSTLSMRRFLKI